MQNHGQYTNHLTGETSPYLLQHVHNPVDWYPWGETALTRARTQNKPILLSIGYSACHWCHVMAHESFEDEQVAAVMNELFINIKVDREERPDLDKIYQSAHSLLTQRAGGWPLTVFLTPDQQIPFFAGTYFPRQPRHGLPSFIDLLRHIDKVYREQPDDIAQQNTAVMNALRQLASPATGVRALNATPLDAARNQLARQFDSQHGGFGNAPKFPHPTSLERLLRHWSRSCEAQEDRQARDMLTLTLERMALGGLNDQIGGGFCRYSTDDEWMIPHFEKMLYDNGPLLALYAQAATSFNSALFANTARATAQWVMREMQSPDGGYYSSLDADSEGEEGRFYVWDREEVRALLTEQDYRVFAQRFGLNLPANFEGHWYPHTFATISAIRDKQTLPEQAVQESLSRACETLFLAREKRVRPGRDDKILTAWNGLMIRGMAKAGRLLNEPAYIASAERALDFIQATLWKDYRLLATYKDGKAHLNAYLDDYVFLIDGILELLQARWKSADLDFAIALMEAVLAHFLDENGGFFFTSDDHEQLIQRPKPAHDEAIPSGNGIATQVLLKLGYLLGDSRYLDAAEQSLRSFWGLMSQNAYACTSLLDALEEQLYPGKLIIIRGEGEAVREWQARLNQQPWPQQQVYGIPDDASGLPPGLETKAATDKTLAYVCEGLQCSPPVHNLEDLIPAG